MDARVRERQQQAYRRQPLWLRPHWWLWTGGCAALILVLSVGAPLLCVVHCALLDMEHQSMLDANGGANVVGLACAIGPTLPADQHLLLQAIFPAILAAAIGIALWPIRHSLLARTPPRLQTWVVLPPVPPPQTSS